MSIVMYSLSLPEFSGGITTLTVRNTIANFCATMTTLIDQDESIHAFHHLPFVNLNLAHPGFHLPNRLLGYRNNKHV